MTPFEAYRDYIALVRHFTTDYDYAQYNGKTRVRASTYEKRRDKFWFEKIARHHDPHWLMIATLVEDPHAWVGEIARAEERYAARKGRVEALEYNVRRDLEAVARGTDELCLRVGQHPVLARRVLGGEFSLESATVVSAVTGCGRLWAQNGDPVLSRLGKTIAKYETFVRPSDVARAVAHAHFFPKAVDTAA